MRIQPLTDCFTHAGEPLGRITFELFKEVVPKTAENFRQFCTGESKDSGGRPQGYKGSKFHRIVSPLASLLVSLLATPLISLDSQLHVPRWRFLEGRWDWIYLHLGLQVIRRRELQLEA